MSTKRMTIPMMLGALLAAGFAVPDHVGKMLAPRVPKRRRWGKPHQGAREMARRRGGQDWQDFKAADRVRRGLPVSWPYQGMEG